MCVDSLHVFLLTGRMVVGGAEYFVDSSCLPVYWEDGCSQSRTQAFSPQRLLLDVPGRVEEWHIPGKPTSE